MKPRFTIQQELRELGSTLPYDAHQVPFSVPEGYFEQLSESLLTAVQADTEDPMMEIRKLSPLLAGISRNMPYSIPADYFQENIEMLPVLTAEETSTLPVQKQMPFAVPEGYFDGFASQVLSKVTEPQKAKLVPMFRRKWAKMAVAASMIGVLAISAMLWFQSPQTENSVAGGLKSVSTKELDAFIKNADPASATATSAPAATEVKGLLEDVSTRELDAFLDAIPTDEENELYN